MPAESDAANTLKTSANPAELAHAAQVLAASARPQDQAALLQSLTSAAFLDRLDPPAKGENVAENMGIARPLRSLQNNPLPARDTLVGLMADHGFNANLSRTDLLITASSTFRPPTQPVIDFWRRHGRLGTLHIGRVITAVLENGDPAAVAEFERILLTTPPAPPDEGGDARVRWLRGPFLEHRDNPAVLAMAQRLLTHPQPPNWTAPIQTTMAEAIFLCQPEWYAPHKDFHAPPLAKTPPAGRQILREIARLVRANLNPSPLLEGGIAGTLSALDTLSG